MSYPLYGKGDQCEHRPAKFSWSVTPNYRSQLHQDVIAILSLILWMKIDATADLELDVSHIFRIILPLPCRTEVADAIYHD